MMIGIPKESRAGETRVAATPDSVKRLIQAGHGVKLEESAGLRAGFADSEYQAAGAKIVPAAESWSSEWVMKVARPSKEEMTKLKPGSLLICLLEPYLQDGLIEELAQNKIDAIALELLPRTSRAQSMDALSSQANIAGYRAVLEAVSRLNRFAPLMMTAAGSAKAARATVIGAGVAGLQAIATLHRLGAVVEAYDVRPEVREQILSLGAKPIEVDLGESGSGSGGYAKELSEEAKKRLQDALNAKLAKSDIIISTANVPGRRAPLLISVDVVKQMRRGSIIIDMAAPSGGNCALTKAGEVVDADGIQIVGLTNYPAMMAADASNFFARNLVSLLGIMKSGIDLKDDILDASVVTYQGAVRKGK